MPERLKIGIACGGTGGHVFPGLATAELLRERGHAVTLWLTDHDMERGAMRRWEGSTQAVKASGFSSRVSWRFVHTVWSLVRAVITCRRRMKADRPDVLLAMGCYASVGPVLGAWSLGTPVVLHESNAVPGRAIAFLSRFSTCVAVAFPEAARYLGRARIVSIGMPLRKELLPRPRQEKSGFTILVMGGSQGASLLNDRASQGLCEAFAGGEEFRVIHLTGPRDEVSVRARYEKAGVPCDVRGFCEDMAGVYAAADLAVCRSGAGSCFELAAWGVPALFVPLPSARRDHQLENARIVAKQGGADVVEEKDFSSPWLAGYFRDSRRDPEKWKNMAEAMRRMARPDAAGSLADLVEKTGMRREG